MNTKLPVRPTLDERVVISLPASDKRRLFEVAAKSNMTVSEMVRRAIGNTLDQQAA